MDKLKAILVDDELDSREILANYLSKYCPIIDLKEKCDSVKSALIAIEKYKPEIVFLDIEMPFGNGFDLLDQVKQITFETVFVTAYDNYAIQALNQSAAYYLLKPIDIDELIFSVEKIREERKSNEYIAHARILLENIKETAVTPSKLMLPTLEGFEIVKTSDIIYCEAHDNFTKFHLIDKHVLLICRTLKYFEEMLAGNRFVRIHRSYMVNLDYVIRYTKGKGGYLTLDNQIELEVSAKQKSKFIDAFKQ